MSNRIKNVVGQQFGRLLVIRFSEMKNNGAWWVCLCSCGKEKVIDGGALRSSHTKSCGCMPKKKPTHGLSKTRIYAVWSSMIGRCNNPSDNSYVNYGKRGIKICERWINSFENFYEDMGNRPTNLHSLDRIDVNGNYEPSNCRWATRSIQNNNKRSNVLLSKDGIIMNMKQWSVHLGISYDKLRSRKKNDTLYKLNLNIITNE